MGIGQQGQHPLEALASQAYTLAGPIGQQACRRGRWTGRAGSPPAAPGTPSRIAGPRPAIQQPELPASGRHAQGSAGWPAGNRRLLLLEAEQAAITAHGEHRAVAADGQGGKPRSAENTGVERQRQACSAPRQAVMVSTGRGGAAAAARCLRRSLRFCRTGPDPATHGQGDDQGASIPTATAIAAVGRLPLHLAPVQPHQ